MYQEGASEYEELQEYVEEPEDTEEDLQEDMEAGDASKFHVGFEELKGINPDIVAWLLIPETEISYPVVQGEDNQYYLKHTFRGEEHIAGSIFLDYRNQPDFSDSRSIIYGHNMKDGSMFHSLKEFQEDGYLEEHGEIWLLLPADIEKIYRITGWEYAAPGGELYQLEEKGDTPDGHELILSTCSSSENWRLVIRGELME